MAHPIYSRQQLLNKKLPKIKQIAAELGVMPTGDKKFIVSWVDAIIEHQTAKVSKIEVIKATINFNSESWDSEAYEVIVNGEVVHQCGSYQMAERHCKWHGYSIIDSQALAQNELEVEMEQQSAQIAETQAIATTEADVIEFVDITFGYYEAVAYGEVIATISQDFDNGEWVVDDNDRFDSCPEAENYVKKEYMNQIKKLHRGSGRDPMPSVIEDMSMIIEDSNFVHDLGQSYTLRINGVLAGSIFLDDDHGWTMNGEDFNDDWRPVARELVKLTRHEYLIAA